MIQKVREGLKDLFIFFFRQFVYVSGGEEGEKSLGAPILQNLFILQSRPCLDDGWESVFGTVAFSFVFNNYCPIMV